MVELLKIFTPFQWFLVAGGLMLLFPAAKNWIISLVNKGGLRPNIVDFTADSKNLTSIVNKWEMLHEACVAAGLSEAHVKLHEVFPLLAKNKESINPEPVVPNKEGEEE